MSQYSRFNKKSAKKRDYYDRISRPTSYQVAPLIVIGGLFVYGMLKNKMGAEHFKASVDEPRQLLTRGQFPDLTPYPPWSLPLYDDAGMNADEAFLNSPARSMGARDSPLPVHSHMARYDVTYDAQQQDMINNNLREQFARWR